MDLNDPRCDFADLRGEAKVAVLWGPSRAVLNRALYGLVTAVSPTPYWVEVRGGDADPEGPGPAELGWIPADHVVALGDLLGSDPAGGPATIAFALISFLRDPTAAAIADALRLPTPAPPLGGAAAPPRPSGAVAIANVDRADQLWPQTPQAMREVVRAFLRAGLVPYFSTQKPTKRREGADFVFEVTAGSLATWRTGALRCEKAPPGASWKEGDRVALTHLPTIAAALGGRLGSAVR
jgi:hypothetical protein